MPRLLIVANPAASGFTGTVYRQAMAYLGDRFDVEPAWPSSANGAQQVAAQAAAEGWDAVVAIGGDGVVHRVANGVAGSDTALAIVPVGTTNVLARILGIPRRLPAALERITSGTARRVTTALIRSNGTQVHGMFAVGVGFDADVVEAAEREPTRKIGIGSLHYARSGLAVLWSRYRRRSPGLQVTVGTDTVRAAAAMVQVLDPYTYLGGLPLRIARPGAGLAVAAIEQVTPARAVRILGRAATGRDLAKVSGVKVWEEVQRVEVLSDEAAPLQADGELLTAQPEIVISPRRAAVTIIS